MAKEIIMVIADIKELDRIEKIVLAPGEKKEVDRGSGYVLVITLHGVGLAKSKDKKEELNIILTADQLPGRLDFWRGQIFEIENEAKNNDKDPWLKCILIWISYKN